MVRVKMKETAENYLGTEVKHAHVFRRQIRNQRVMQHFIKMFNKKHSKDMTKDKRSIQKLRREVEKAKRALSSTHQARVEIEALYDGVDFSETFARARFEEINNDLFKNTLSPMEQVMEDPGPKKTHVDEIVLVGGSTRIPKVQQLIKDPFNGKEPNCGMQQAFVPAPRVNRRTQISAVAGSAAILGASPALADKIGDAATKLSDASYPFLKEIDWTSYVYNTRPGAISHRLVEGY